MAGCAEYDHVNRKLRTLQHCALYRRTIRLICPGCRRERRFDAVALWWMFERRGWNDRLPSAYGRLYCDACLVKAGRKIRPQAEITREQPDAHQPPYHDETTWKRLVSRYRS